MVKRDMGMWFDCPHCPVVLGCLIFPHAPISLWKLKEFEGVPSSVDEEREELGTKFEGGRRGAKGQVGKRELWIQEKGSQTTFPAGPSRKMAGPLRHWEEVPPLQQLPEGPQILSDTINAGASRDRVILWIRGPTAISPSPKLVNLERS